MQLEHVAAPGAEWDAFVTSVTGGHLGHAAAWADVLRFTYGLAPRYLACRADDGSLQGVLPLFDFRTLRGRRELISIPFHDVAGILCSSPAAEAQLLEGALSLARERGAAALELRQGAPLPSLPASPASPPAARVNLVLALPADEDALWKGLGAKVRNQTRKAEKEGLTLASWDPPELLDGFYRCFAENMRDLGSPAHARSFFHEMARAFGPRLRCFVAADGARAVGGLVAIHYADRVTVTWASTLRAERARCPNNLIYWQALRWAVSLRATHFDFGRSPVGGGTHRFKLSWGAEEAPLTWQRLTPSGQPLPISQASADPLLSRLSALWQRMPLGLTSRLGPMLRRRLAN
ncbi:MAG TPA: GNAT family N-acetyltransferase [Myxococcota bacterium]|nr:GNAT family N-acetyltransferase [Myxococcota bacterium]